MVPIIAHLDSTAIYRQSLNATKTRTIEVDLPSSIEYLRGARGTLQSPRGYGRMLVALSSPGPHVANRTTAPFPGLCSSALIDSLLDQLIRPFRAGQLANTAQQNDLVVADQRFPSKKQNGGSAVIDLTKTPSPRARLIRSTSAHKSTATPSEASQAVRLTGRNYPYVVLRLEKVLRKPTGCG
ncbi:IQ calmodulin-binding motif protein [Neofusicoccum parvum]|nr:IQ calmodulin-binding motif protein [Neofusicoccum parvum]